MTAPTQDPIQWASDANFTSGPRSGSPTKDTAMTAGVAAQGIVAGQTLKGEQVNECLHNHSEWLLHAFTELGGGVYGDGSDGALASGFGTLTLTRDMFYTDGELLASDTIEANGFRVHFTGTLTNAGAIHVDGAAGVDGDSGATGGAGGASGTLGGGSDGSDGGTNAIGSSVSPLTAHLGGDGGEGGASNHGSPGASVRSGGSGTAPSAAQGSVRSLNGYLGVLQDGTVVSGGAGGAGGSGGDTGSGGGGGGGGGVLVLAARELINDGTISALGGDGAQGQLGPDADGNGGGGGGGGGVVILVTRRHTGSGSVRVDGGAGGDGALTSGDRGSDGDDGIVIELQG